MSGFVGWVDFQRDLSTEKDTFHAMTEAMRKRGPDGVGVWLSRDAALGHRSLSTTASQNGKQPILVDSERGAAVLAYTGRIYNLGEIKRTLDDLGATFKTGSDTEVLLQSYLRWGDHFVSQLNGMFALAIWDQRARQLLLARDHLGLQPLYYFEYSGGLLFASEPKGIIANPLFEARLDFSAMTIVLQPRLALPGETPLIGLRELPPAHVASYAKTGLSLRRYWKLTSAPHDETFDATARHVRGLMEDAVTRQFTVDASRGDAIGLMLSGGLDSTSVAALAMKTLHGEKSDKVLKSFCIEFDTDAAHFVPTELRPDVDAPYAAKAAEFIGTCHKTVTVSTRDVLEVIPETRRARDLPGWGQFDGSTYLLFREMRRHCIVGLTGEVGDELFGGYPYFFDPERLQRDNFPWLEDGPKLANYLAPDLMAQVDPRADERARYSQWISDVPRLDGEDAESARMREVFYLTMSGRLSVLLDRMDRMSMTAGLEMRLPFCDHRLVEYLWNVPWSMKCAGGMKGLLKAAMADLLPACTLDRKKSAFPHIQNRDYDLALIRDATSIVNDKCSPVAAMFDTPRLKELIQEISGDNARVHAAHVLIQLVEMKKWFDEYHISVR